MKRKLGELLIEIGVINAHQLQSALEHQKRFKDKLKLGASLVALGFINEDKLTQLLSRHLNIPLVDLNLEFISPDVTDLVPPEVAEQYKVMPFKIFEENRKKILGLAMSDPTNLEPIDVVQFHTSLNIRPFVASTTSIERAIQRYYHGLILDSISYVGNPQQARELEPPSSTSGPKIISRGDEINWNGEVLKAPVTPKRITTERTASPPDATMMREMMRVLQETNAMMKVLVKKGIITEEELTREVQAHTADEPAPNPSSVIQEFSGRLTGHEDDDN